MHAALNHCVTLPVIVVFSWLLLTYVCAAISVLNVHLLFIFLASVFDLSSGMNMQPSPYEEVKGHQLPRPELSVFEQ